MRVFYAKQRIILAQPYFTKKRLQHRCFSCEYCEIFKNSCFYRTSPLAASALNFILHFQVVNSGCTISSRQFEVEKSCSFICNFIFVIFSSHVEILILSGSYDYDEIEHVLFFQNLIKLIWSNKNVSNFAVYIIKLIWFNKFDQINLTVY